MKVKIVIRSESTKDGTHQLYIRVTPKGKQAVYSALDMTVHKDDWDIDNSQFKVTKKDWKKLNADLAKLENDWTDYLSKITLQRKPEPTAQQLLKKLFPHKYADDFHAYADSFINALENNNTKNNRTSGVNALKEFRVTLKFADINEEFLEAFQSYLHKKVSKNTASTYLRAIKSIYDKAIEDGIVEKKESAFLFFKIKGGKPSRRDTLEDHEIILYHNFDFPVNSMEYHARNAYIFAVNSLSMRVGDIINTLKTDIRYFEKENEYRFQYVTGKNKKGRDILLIGEALRIYNLYKDSAGDYLFPFMDIGRLNTERKIALHRIKGETAIADAKEAKKRHLAITSATFQVNTYLDKGIKKCKIAKHITSHSNRNFVARKFKKHGKGSDALGHEDAATTKIYELETQAEKDRALDGIILYSPQPSDEQ